MSEIARVSGHQRLQIEIPYGSAKLEKGVLNYNGGRLQCHICARWYISLVSHIRRAHHWDHEDYREEFGLNKGTPLVTPQLSLRFHNAILKRFPNGVVPGLHYVLPHDGITWEVREETRRRLSASLKGKKLRPHKRRPPTFETRRKISLALQGRPLSFETRRKLSLALKGKPVVVTPKRLAAQKRQREKARLQRKRMTVGGSQ